MGAKRGEGLVIKVDSRVWCYGELCRVRETYDDWCYVETHQGSIWSVSYDDIRIMNPSTRKRKKKPLYLRMKEV